MRGSLALWLLMAARHACSTRTRAPGTNETAVQPPNAMHARRQLQTATMDGSLYAPPTKSTGRASTPTPGLDSMDGSLYNINAFG